MMLQSETEHQLREFLKDTDGNDLIHLVMVGAVASGQYFPPVVPGLETIINLQNATVYTGLQATKLEEIFVPFEKVIAWGEGEVSSSAV